MPKIAIVIPVYNGEKWISNCLDSVINQTFKDIEIIVVNDGSTDNTEKVCLKYQQKDERIKVVFQENKGLPAARNTGLRNAKGEYILFVDSDDTIELNTCEICISEMEKSDNVDVLYFGFNIFDHGKLLRQPNPGNHDMRLSSKSYNEFCSFSNVLASACNKMYKASSLKYLFNESLVFGEDIYFNLSILSKDTHIKTISESFYNVNLDNQDSVNKKYKEKKLFAEYQCGKLMIQKYTEIFGKDINFSQVYKEYIQKVSYFSEIAICCNKNSFKHEIKLILDDDFNKEINRYKKDFRLHERIVCGLLVKKQINMLVFYLRAVHMVRSRLPRKK